MKRIYDWDVALSLYDLGHPDSEIAESLGCCRASVVLWRHNNELPSNCPRGLNRISRDKIQEVYSRLEAQEPMRDIAESVGVSLETIRKFAIRRGLPMISAPIKYVPKKDGTTKDRSGYILVRVPVDSEYGYLIRANTRGDPRGYAPLHRIVMHQKLGRMIGKDEVVHHVDGNILNNSPENLEIYATNAEHLKASLTGKVPNWTARFQLLHRGDICAKESRMDG